MKKINKVLQDKVKDAGGKGMRSFDKDAKKFSAFNSKQMTPQDVMKENPMEEPKKQNMKIMAKLKPIIQKGLPLKLGAK